jgi:hypothetical protein
MAMASSMVRALVTTMATTGTPLRAALTPAMANALTWLAMYVGASFLSSLLIYLFDVHVAIGSS